MSSSSDVAGISSSEDGPVWSSEALSLLSNLGELLLLDSSDVSNVPLVSVDESVVVSLSGQVAGSSDSNSP